MAFYAVVGDCMKHMKEEYPSNGVDYSTSCKK
jgi:hypothetical protein